MFPENQAGEGRIKVNILRGDLYYADLTPVTGSEQGGVRPVLMIQNDMGNRFSPTVIVAAVTSRQDKHPLPTHVQPLRPERALRCTSGADPDHRPYPSAGVHRTIDGKGYEAGGSCAANQYRP